MLVGPTVQNEINAHIDVQCAGSEARTCKYSKDRHPVEGLLLEPILKSRQPKGMTYKKLHKQIMLGHGQGHGSSYQPWLQIHRKNPSPISNQVVAWLPTLRRTAHFFSRGEYHTALLLLWLQVHDMREQYPIWPVAHPHPLTDVDDTANSALPWSRGLLAIAKEAGIEHGVEIGSRQPYVATIDFAVTVRFPEAVRLFTFSSKPIIDPENEIKWRTLERLEMERRYASEVGATHAIATSALVPIRMAGHLEWWLDASTLDGQTALVPHAEHFAANVERHRDASIAEAVKATAKHMSIPLDSAWLLFRYCAWTQKIDIDPSMPILTSYPIRPGGHALRATLRRALFQGNW